MNRFVLEAILRPYFKHKKYYFAVHSDMEIQYDIENIKFGKISGNSSGWIVGIRYDEYTETVEVALDDIMVFIYESNITKTPKNFGELDHNSNSRSYKNSDIIKSPKEFGQTDHNSNSDSTTFLKSAGKFMDSNGHMKIEPDIRGNTLIGFSIVAPDDKTE